MKIFFDENFSPALAAGFTCFQNGCRTEGVDVHHVIDHFERGTPDEKWIPAIAQMHGVVITQDFDIHRTRQLYSLCEQFKLGVFFFRPPKKTPYRYWQWIQWVLQHWEHIKIQAGKTTPPFGFTITPRSKIPERL